MTSPSSRQRTCQLEKQIPSRVTPSTTRCSTTQTALATGNKLTNRAEIDPTLWRSSACVCTSELHKTPPVHTYSKKHHHRQQHQHHLAGHHSHTQHLHNLMSVAGISTSFSLSLVDVWLTSRRLSISKNDMHNLNGATVHYCNNCWLRTWISSKRRGRDMTQERLTQCLRCLWSLI